MGRSERELTHLSLFSGIGGLDLAAEWAGFKTVGQCEYADYPTKVLQKHWPDVPRWRDVHDLTAESFYERTGQRSVDVLSGGFPCQPHSLSGKRLASDDERDLWGKFYRIACELRPRWIVAENVRGLLSSEHGRFFGRVLRDLARWGGSVWWYCFPARAVSAAFRGDRVAIVATSACVRRDCMDANEQSGCARIVDACSQRQPPRSPDLSFRMEWSKCKASSGFLRNDDGLPSAMDRLRCAGNSIVPHQFYPIFLAIREVERMCDAHDP